MQCPHCEKEIEGKVCSACGKNIPEKSRYCMQCGARQKNKTTSSGEERDPYDLETRILCPDGSCTGIIVDGKCIECGKPYEG